MNKTIFAAVLAWTYLVCGALSSGTAQSGALEHFNLNAF